MDKSLAIPPMPSVEVIEDGKPVSGVRIDPAVASFIAQMTIAAQLAKMRKLEESKIPTGVKTISMTIGTDVVELVLYPPWISCSLINDAGSAMTAWVNDEAVPQSDSMIAVTESISLDMTYPVIRRLYMKSAGTSAVRIYGKEGKV